MSVQAGKWSDLRLRIISAAVMVVVAGFDIWLGGRWFLVMLALISAAMVWEAARLGNAPSGLLRDWVLPFAGGLSVVVAQWVGVPLGFGVIAVVAAGVFLLAAQLRQRLAFYAFFAMVAALCLFFIREVYGLAVLLWLIGIVIASDVMGYFAGRVFGGPKFWPSVSPKKTWSGTIAGWAGAAVVGWLFSDILIAASNGGLPLSIPVFSVLLAFAAQMGDIVESALKRQAGIKDSSSLIPGHGGVLDRFDGMIGAALLFLPVVFVAEVFA